MAIPGIVRDSAGIQIVQNNAPVWRPGEKWRIGPELLRIGAGESADGEELHRVAGAVRLSDGSIVIADGGSAELRRYTADGRYVGSSGGAGEGPGEFRSLTWIGRTEGDSILAWDGRLLRVSVFSPGGEYARTYSPELEEELVGQRVVGATGEGRLVMTRGSSFEPVGGVAGIQRQPLTVWRIDPEGQIELSIGPFAGETVELRPARSGEGIIRTSVPFGATTHIGANSGRIHVSESGRFDIHVYGPDGMLERKIRRPADSLPVMASDLTAWIEAQLAPLPPIADVRAGMRASFERVTPADFIPLVQSLVVDAEGNLWVESGRHAEDLLATYSVFDAGGAWLGDVTLDGGMEVLEIGDDFVIVLVRDELDVESVRLLALERPSASTAITSSD
jgi:hypothetical protein